MKISVIHGSQRKGNTEKTIDIVKAKLNSFVANEFFDFYLPKDLPSFCCGCFKCLEKGSTGGECCPHAEYTHPILQAMKLSDGIIIELRLFIPSPRADKLKFSSTISDVFL